MRLADLDACFLGKYDAEKDSFCEQTSIDGAQGVMFDCPLCQRHSVLCWFNNPINAPAVPETTPPLPGRWIATGETLDDLTLSPSVNLDTESAREHHSCLWHGYVMKGDAK